MQAEATNFTDAHNAALMTMTNSFSSSMSGSTVLTYDIYTFFNNLMTNAATVCPLTMRAGSHSLYSHGATCYAAFSFHIVIIVYTDSWFESYRFSNLVANTSLSTCAHVVAMQQALLVLTIQLRVVMLSSVYQVKSTSIYK